MTVGRNDTSGVTVTLSGGGAFYSEATCNPANAITTTTVSPAAPSAPVYYKATAAGADTLTAAAAGYGSGSKAISVVAGAPYGTNSSIVASPSPVEADGTASATVTVTLRDQWNNPVSGFLVFLGATGSGNTLTQPSSNTDASGVASGSIKSTAAGTKTLSVSGISGLSSTVNFTVTPPAQVTGLAATTPAANTVHLTWTPSTGTGPITYKVLKSSTPGSGYGFLASNISGTTFDDAPGTNNQTWYYVVVATNAGGDASQSSEASAIPQMVPNAPTGASATVISNTELLVSWADNSNNESSFKIEFSTDNLTWNSLTMLAAGTTAYSHAGLTPGQTYYYRIQAQNSVSGSSAYSNTASATTPVNPPALLSYDVGSLDFGTIGIGKTASLAVRVSNTGTLDAYSITPSFSTYEYGFRDSSYPGGGNCGTIIRAGETCIMYLTFTPSGTPETTGTLTLNYQNGLNGSTASLSLAGAGTTLPMLTISDFPRGYYQDYGIPADSSSFSFGQVGLSQSKQHVFTVTNVGAGQANAISPSISSGFAVTANSCGSLQPGESCTVTVQFAPTGTGPRNDNLTVNWMDTFANPGTNSRPITGSGFAGAVLGLYDFLDDWNDGLNSGPAYDFEVRGVGASANHIFYLINSGGATATGITGSPLGSNFRYAGGGFPGGVPGASADNHRGVPFCGGTLDPGQTCAIGIEFVPTGSTSYSTSVTISGGGSSAMKNLLGAGTSKALLQITTMDDGGSGVRTDFGWAATTASKSAYFQVTNVGGALASSLTPYGSFTSQYHYSNGGFPGATSSYNGISPCANSMSLAQGSSCLVRVDFNPNGPGTWADQLQFQYYDGFATQVAARSLIGFGTNQGIVSVSNCFGGGNCGGGGGESGIKTDDWGYFRPSTPEAYRYYRVTNDGNMQVGLNAPSLNDGFTFPGGSFPGNFLDSNPPSVYGQPQPDLYCSTTLNPHSSCVIRVQFNSATVSPHATQLDIELTGATAPRFLENLAATVTDHAIVSIQDWENSGSSNGSPFQYPTAGVPIEHTFYIRNNGQMSAGISAAQFTFAGSGFNFSGNTYPGGSGTRGSSGTIPACASSIPSGTSCWIAVTYTPNGTLTSSSSIHLALNASDSVNTLVTRDLKGTGTNLESLVLTEGGMESTPSDSYPYNFGSVMSPSGDSGARDIYLFNRGGMIASGINITLDVGAFAFFGPGFPGGSGSHPSGLPWCAASQTLSPGTGCVMTLHFQPATAGGFSGYIHASDGGASPAARLLTGTGS